MGNQTVARCWDVYDSVWVFENNKPKKKIVFAVIKSMNYWKTGTETFYQLVNSRIGAGWGNNEGVRRDHQSMFSTKEELIRSLIKTKEI